MFLIIAQMTYGHKCSACKKTSVCYYNTLQLLVDKKMNHLTFLDDRN